MFLRVRAAVDAAGDQQPAGVGSDPGGARACKDCAREGQQLLNFANGGGGEGAENGERKSFRRD